MQNSSHRSSSTSIFHVSTAAVIALASSFVSGCAVDADDSTEADSAQITFRPLPPPTPPPPCFAVPAPVITHALAPFGSQGWHGTHSTESTYGDRCTPYYVIETTNTLGAGDLELTGQATVDDALNHSSQACMGASITVEAWGCTSINSAGGCTHWENIDAKTHPGFWNTSGLGSPCLLSAALASTTTASAYFTIRLGAKANKVLSGGTPASLPVTARIGYDEIN